MLALKSTPPSIGMHTTAWMVIHPCSLSDSSIAFTPPDRFCPRTCRRRWEYLDACSRDSACAQRCSKKKGTRERNAASQSAVVSILIGNRHVCVMGNGQNWQRKMGGVPDARWHLRGLRNEGCPGQDARTRPARYDTPGRRREIPVPRPPADRTRLCLRPRHRGFQRSLLPRPRNPPTLV
jgi:hypothetical protein